MSKDFDLNAIHQHKVLGFPDDPDPTPSVGRRATLELMRRRRDSGARPAVLTDERGESFGCMQLAIPELDYQVLIVRFPELNSKDPEIMTRAWQKFANDPASLPYRVDASIGRRKVNHGIIVK